MRISQRELESVLIVTPSFRGSINEVGEIFKILRDDLNVIFRDAWVIKDNKPIYTFCQQFIVVVIIIVYR